jgi:hypothetical protein
MKAILEKIKTYYKLHWLSIDFIPAWNFLTAKQSGDVRYLIKNIDYERLPEILEIQRKTLENVFTFLDYQVAQFSIDTSRRNQIIFDLNKKIASMEADYNQVKNIVEYLLLAGPDEEFYPALKEGGFVIDMNLPFWNELERIKASNENKRIKINEQKAELKALTGSNTESNTNETEEVLIALEKHNKKDIDLKAITMRKWLTLKNDLSKAIEKQQLKSVK